MINDRRIVEKMEVTVGGTRIESKRPIKYLAVIIDDRFNFKEHENNIGKEISVIQGALRRMMSNIGAPGPFKRRIIFIDSNVDNGVCLPNMVEDNLRGDDKEDIVLGVSSKWDHTDK